MDNKEKLKLASELLELLNEETEISEAAVYKETETEVNTVIEKASITETEYIARRRDMEELSDFFCRDSRRYDNGFEVY